MHEYLRAIGFSKITREGLDNLLYNITKNGDVEVFCLNSSKEPYAEYRSEISGKLGVAVRGYYDDGDRFVIDDYFPYLRAENVTSTVDVEIQKLKDSESYCGICEDARVGISLIFFLQNAMEMRKNIGDHGYRGETNICLSALSTQGKIILPVKKESYVNESGFDAGGVKGRSELVAAAREGDQEAIENLTLEDMDVYAMISKRVEKEDVLSIVETSLMPYGVESDLYGILGTITNYERRFNPISKEEVFILEVEVNEMTFEVAINRADLLGEPEIGRRFRGQIWMQGKVIY